MDLQFKAAKSNQLGGTAMQSGVLQCRDEEDKTQEGLGAGEGLGAEHGNEKGGAVMP